MAKLGLKSFVTILLLMSCVVTGQIRDEIIRVDTELVAFEVSIADKLGNPVRGLKIEDFRLFVNGERRAIDFFSPIKKNDHTRPLSVVFVLDVSGSITREELSRLKIAMEKFIKRMADYNSHFAVMTFGMRVKTVQNFTNSARTLDKTFDKILKDRDGLSTHAYDAVDKAVRLIRKKSPKTIGRQIPKRVVIVVSDGYPVGDTVSPETVIERANDAATSVYALILPSYSTLSIGNKPVLTLLEASGLTEKTGGRTLYAVEKDFNRLFAELAEEITASYALAFYSDGLGKNRISHEVRIETSGEYVVKQNRSTFEKDEKNQ